MHLISPSCVDANSSNVFFAVTDLTYRHCFTYRYGEFAQQQQQQSLGNTFNRIPNNLIHRCTARRQQPQANRPATWPHINVENPPTAAQLLMENLQIPNVFCLFSSTAAAAALKVVVISLTVPQTASAAKLAVTGNAVAQWMEIADSDDLLYERISIIKTEILSKAH